jgi:hypothetical protein
MVLSKAAAFLLIICGSTFRDLTAYAARDAATQTNSTPVVEAEKPHSFKFCAYMGDPRHPEKMDFQINTLDRKLSTAFLKLGDIIPHTHLRLDKFIIDKGGLETYMGDLSELTLIDTVTKERFYLVLGKLFRIPSSRLP